VARRQGAGLDVEPAQREDLDNVAASFNSFWRAIASFLSLPREVCPSAAVVEPEMANELRTRGLLDCPLGSMPTDRHS
jgi:hypothetical protein